MSDPRDERMFAVAIRDAEDLFLWIRIRRSRRGDIYYMFPTGRSGPEWKKWNPHGSHHKDGRSHHKSFDRKMLSQRRQKPDSHFKGTECLIARPIARNEPRAFGEICNPTEFAEVMQVPATILSNETYKTYTSIHLTEPGRSVTDPGVEVLAQRTFDDSIPWIVVSVYSITDAVMTDHHDEPAPLPALVWAVIYALLLVAAVAIFALVLIR
jgi:hypothetical protein